MNNSQELIKLISENPSLPVIPMVDYEVVSDDGCARWLGSFGRSYIGEYALFDEKNVIMKTAKNLKKTTTIIIVTSFTRSSSMSLVSHLRTITGDLRTNKSL